MIASGATHAAPLGIPHSAETGIVPGLASALSVRLSVYDLLTNHAPAFLRAPVLLPVRVSIPFHVQCGNQQLNVRKQSYGWVSC